MNIQSLGIIDSTNNWLAYHEKELQAPLLVFCHTQKAGRGQRGNSWESEPGKNITASLLFRLTDFPALQQFQISEAIALAITEFLKEEGVEAKVKWPNDIYVGDKKICGILVEHSVTGRFINRTIAGFGINLNQTEFKSGAPNPISLKMLTRKEYNVEKCVEKLGVILKKYIDGLDSRISYHEKFLSKLWRGDKNYYKFFDRKNEEFIDARISEIAQDGLLTLTTADGQSRVYAFKEVEFLI